MEIGGSCGSGGPYVYSRPCPDGAIVAIFGGAWGGVVAFFVYLWLTLKHGVPGWIWLSWPAVFLALGWNFLEFGLNPPGKSDLELGWLICAVVFGLMGGGPLVLFAKPIAKSILPLPGKPADPLRGYDSGRREPVLLVEPTFDPGPRVEEESGDDVVDSLERLAALRRSGALTEDEFEAAKERVLEDSQ